MDHLEDLARIGEESSSSTPCGRERESVLLTIGLVLWCAGVLRIAYTYISGEAPGVGLGVAFAAVAALVWGFLRHGGAAALLRGGPPPEAGSGFSRPSWYGPRAAEYWRSLRRR